MSKVNELAERYFERPTTELKEQIVKAYSPRLWQMARQEALKHKRPEDANDLVSVGYYALIRLIDRFDPSKAGFETFAQTTVFKAFLRYYRDESNTIRKPAYFLSFHDKQRKVRVVLEKNLNRPPTEDEVAEAMGVSSEELADNNQLLQQTNAMQLRSDSSPYSDLDVPGAQVAWTPKSLICSLSGTLPSSLDDNRAKYEDAYNMVVKEKSTTEALQRHFGLGYFAAMRLRSGVLQLET